jgi:ectoine hydroxylase-related dioxygenase (phytanoyl-CoA dioxygenase family)
MITRKDIENYARDGVVFLPGAFERKWIELLRRGVEQNLANPSGRSRTWSRDERGRTCFYDSQVWREIPAYRKFVIDSPCAEIAGRLMGCSTVNFFFDAVFIRSPGTQFRTPWHQDEPYWSVEGFDTCSVWMPLVQVEKRSALEFVRGSHTWPQKFGQTNFAELTGDARDRVEFTDPDSVPFPDIEKHRADYDILSWGMDPGDCVVFNARTIHGGSGKLSPGRGLEVFNTKWLGDDVRIRFRESGMDPDHSAIMSEVGLRPGDRPGTDLYPQLWVRP